MTDDMDPVVSLWRSILSRLETDHHVTPQLLGFAENATPKGVLGDTLYLEVKEELTRKKLELNLRISILNALATIDDTDVSNFAVVVNPEAVMPPVLHAPDPERVVHVVATPQPAPVAPQLNPKYTFDTFVVGPSNRLAHAAAFAVAEAPAMAYNPLFIYGSSGLGKTHLLHAIGHYAISLSPGIRVRYVSSEEFTNDFINAIRTNEQAAFMARYRDVDILLVDDIQFLQRAQETQEAFFHTFNTLYEHNKQVVVTSDVAPRQLVRFEERMTSRFEWGLTTDVQAPDLATRIAILRTKAQSDRLDIPGDVLEYIGSRVSNNVRELEGTLLKVTAYASLNKEPITLDLVKTALKDVIPLSDGNHIAPAEILSTVARYYGVTVDDLRGTSRTQQLALARHIAMYLCRELTDLSLPKIASIFGNRDHSTVLYANKKINALMSESVTVYNEVNELSGQLKHAQR